MELIVLTIILGGTLLLALYIGKIFKSDAATVPVHQPEQEEVEEVKEVSGGQKTKKKIVEKKQKEKAFTFQHPWLVTSLKGHSGRVLDMDLSPSGRYLASCGEDRTVLVWSTKDFMQKEHKCLRCNVEYDHGTFVKWSPDSKAFVVQKATQNCTEVYKMGKKADGSVGEFSVAVTLPALHTTDTVGLGISREGKFIATCSDKTDLIVWSIKGDVLERIDTVHNLTYCCKVSPCGRYVATSGFTPDVKVWEVKFSRGGEFEKVVRAFTLTSHRSGVHSFSFSADSGRMATVSKDGTWKVFDTAVEWGKGQDPSVVASGEYEGDPALPSLVTLSPDGKLVCLARDRGLTMYSAVSGEKVAAIPELHSQPITQVLFSADGQLLLTAGDKHVRVLHNVPGININIQELRAALRRNATNSAAKERIEQQIRAAELRLAAVSGS